jgi:hypothetical protein
MKVTLASIAAILVLASSLFVEAVPTHHTEETGHSDAKTPSDNTKEVINIDELVEAVLNGSAEISPVGSGKELSDEEYDGIMAGEDSTLKDGDLCEKHEDCPPGYGCAIDLIALFTEGEIIKVCTSTS